MDYTATRPTAVAHPTIASRPIPALIAIMPVMWGEPGQALDWQLDPLEALRRWPAHRPVAMLHSGRFHPRWSRWSVLAEPGAAYRFTTHSQWIPGRHPASAAPPSAAARWTHDPIDDVARVTADASTLWLGYLSYDLGRFIEFMPSLAAADRDWPLVQMHACPGWLLHDAETGRWSAHGTWKAGSHPPLDTLPPRDEPFDADTPHPQVDRPQYEQTVQRVIDYIAAGDVFQVNLTQRFTAPCRGNPRTVYARLARQSPAWYGAYIECLDDRPDQPRRIIASTSPELFLDVNADGRVITRPIKGTRPATVPAAELETSEKDQAELNMIVDLLRNDLGRVARFGSVQVEAAREIESHPTVHHGVATISAQLQPRLGLADLLRATLPGGSITGAPKIRAMQIIEELEPTRRGPYCGTIGAIQGHHARLNLAIRTLLLELDQTGTGRVDFSVGGGIVADSNPAAEYQETLDKAAALIASLT